MTPGLKWTPLAVLCALIISVPSVWANWAQDGLALCAAANRQEHPTITSAGAGGAIVVWEDWRSEFDVYAQRVNGSGAVQWAVDGVVICTATGMQYSPVIVADDAGGAIVAWTDRRNGNEDIYAQRVDASGAAQWTADGVALCTATGGQYHSTIASDGAGGAIVTWSDAREGIENVYDVYAQRVDASGAVQWTEDGIAISTAAGTQVYPQIMADGAGGAFIVWTDSRNVNFDIYAQRVNALGTIQWTADGVALCTQAPGAQNWPQITSDGEDGAIVAWSDNRAETHIYAQRVNASGTVQWTADGVELCPAAGFQGPCVIVSDGIGGALVAWQDQRRGFYYDYDIYAQRVDASGAIQWPAEGVAVCTAYGRKEYLKITSDGDAGMIVTWQDNRFANIYDIYAQRVNASGVVEWTSNGAALCTASGHQKEPQITSDGMGGAIVAWYDYRAGNAPDIYALRVDADGFAPPTTADAPAVPIELRQNYPNPFNPTTTITYSVPEECNVTLEIYDISGRCVAHLIDTQQEKGSYAVEWNGKDGNGKSVASGIYLYRLGAGNQTISKKMVLLR